jgi:FdhD protein
MSSAVISVPIGRVNGPDALRCDDILAVEEALEIRLGSRSLSITMRTPGNDAELAAGFLFSEGIIRDASQIRLILEAADGNPNIVRVELADSTPPVSIQSQRSFAMTSACGVC